MSHLKDAYQPTTTMECNMGFVFLHCSHVSFQTSSVLLDILDFDQSPISNLPRKINASTTQANHPIVSLVMYPPFSHSLITMVSSSQGLYPPECSSCLYLGFGPFWPLGPWR